MACMTGPGGPDRLEIMDIPLPEPGPGEALVRQTAIGVNYVDIYHRRGLHQPPAFPAPLGVEAVGVVEALGPGVIGLAPGDRVAMAGAPIGSYAAARVVAADALIPLPADLPDRLVAGSFLRGLTAHLLLVTLGRIGAGQTLLIHGAAGGLGLALVQWAKRLGAVTLGVVGSPEKAAVALAHGLDHAIDRRREDFVEVTRALTGGRGVDLVVDGIGGDTFTRSLEVLAPFGTLANVGMVGGPAGPVDLAKLVNRRASRPSVLAHVHDRPAYRSAAEAWFAVLRDGLLVSEGRDYALVDAAQAQADLEAGVTTGAIRLIP
jgi:NADPH2:quinone reductase